MVFLKVSFYFCIDVSLTILSASPKASCPSLEEAGIGKQEMALPLVADNPVQLRPSPRGFLKAHGPQTLPELWPHSYPFTNQELTNTICTFFSVLLWLGGKNALLVVVFIQKVA